MLLQTAEEAGDAMAAIVEQEVRPVEQVLQMVNSAVTELQSLLLENLTPIPSELAQANIPLPVMELFL